MMAWSKVLSLVVILLMFVVSVVVCDPDYGVPNPATYPSYQERTFLSLLNAARVGPAAYKSNYMSGYPYSTTGILTTAAVPPIFIDNGLVQSSRLHSYDESVNCPANYLTNNDCSGGSWVTRIQNYYSCSGSLTEDLLLNYYTTPIDSVNQVLCSVQSSGSCCPDTSSCASMRKSVLSTTYTRAGAGNAIRSSNQASYWTLDMGSCVPSGDERYPSVIASGSHIIQSNGNTRFIAQFYNPSGIAPSSASVVINNQAFALALDGGVSTKGNYYYQAASGSTCRQYYFTFVVNGVTYYYPSVGFFYTYGEGSCTSDYGSSGSTPTPSPTPASSPSSSASPSSSSSPSKSSSPSPSPGTSPSASPSASASRSTSPSASPSSSPSASPTPTPAQTAPRAPTALTAGAVTSSSIALSWKAPSDNGGSAITHYIVSFTASGTTQTQDALTATSTTLTGLVASTTYTITVTAQNAIGSSPASASISAITSSSTPGNQPCTSASCLPASFNFRTSTSCSAGILNQASCGCCYAFSTAVATSDRLCYQSKINVVSSPQDILNCGSRTIWSGSTACDGGDPYQAATFQVSHGLATASSAALTGGCRPFTCSKGSSYCTGLTCSSTCADGSAYNPYKAVKAYRIAQDPTTIMLDIYNNGPVTAAFDVYNSFYNFFESSANVQSVFTTDCNTDTSGYAGGHSVTLIGWGTDNNGVPYWLIANSWTSSWGDKGLFRMKRGVNLCGIEDYVVGTNYTVVSRRRDEFEEPAVPAHQERDTSVYTGVAVPADASTPGVAEAAQLILDTWYFNKYYADTRRRALLEDQTDVVIRAAAADGMMLSTANPYTVSSINNAYMQPVAGQTVGVDFVASNGAESVNLVSSVTYGAADGAVSVGSISASGAGGSSAALSTGAIVGIAVGGGVGLLLIGAGLVTVAVVGGVIYAKTRGSTVEEVEMEEDIPTSQKRKSWWVRSKRFQSITGRSPPIKQSV